MIEAPRISRGTVCDWLRGRQRAELGGVRATHHGEARGAKTLGEPRVAGLPKATVAQGGHSLAVGLARLLAAGVLQDERHARERLRERICALRLRAGPIEAPVDHGIQGRGELLDALDGRLDELRRAHFPRADEMRPER